MLETSAKAIGKPAAKALRLIFSFDGYHVNLVSQQSIEMTLPFSDSLDGIEGHNGFWYELRDDQDRPLYRKFMQNPMQEDVEVFSDEPNKKSIARQTSPNRKGVFVALIPDVENGHAVTLWSSPRRIQLNRCQPASLDVSP